MIGAAMRIVKVGVLAPTNKGIPLGVQGENRATEVEFDTRPWFREYPSGTVSAVSRRDGDPAPYPLSLDVADGTAVWQVSDTDTAKAGEGAVELTMTSGGARVRSLTFKTLVTASLTDAPVDDDAWYGWLDKAVVKVDETVQSAQRKMDEVDAEWTDLKADVTAKVEECGEAAAQAASDAHHAKVDAQATAKALESAEGSVAKAEAAATRAEGAAEQAYGAAGQASVSAGNASDAASDAREALAHAAGWADRADKSATRAAESEENAARSASSAADSAERATAQKVAAENAKDAAESFKAGAEAAKNEAATSASNAAESATAAAKSAGDAAASVDAINVISPLHVNRNRPAVSVSEYALAIGRDAKADSADGVAIGPNAHAIASAVALGTGSVADTNGTISVGSNETKRRIMNVASPTYETDVSNKKYTDDNDAKTLNEAKKYTDANTSNALVGTVSGKLLHVEDAWPSKPLGLTIDGKSEQVKTIGKNLLNGCDSYFKDADSTLKSYLWGYSLASNPLTLDKPLGPGEYTFSFYSTTICPIYFSKKPYVIGQYVNFSANNVIDGDTRFGLKRYYCTFTLTDTYELMSIYGGDYKACFGGMIEKGQTVSAYEPYTAGKPSPSPDYPQEITVVENPVLKVTGADTSAEGASIPITLPAEHPYLAALPDGTHDEIVIDKDGNASLVARVQKADVSNLIAPSSSNPLGNGLVRYQYIGIVGTAAKRDSATLAPAFENVINYQFPTQGMYVSNTSLWIGAAEDPTDAIKAGGYIYTTLATPVTYPLGKLDIPSLPETISNVWIEASLTPECDMTYKQDVNVVIAGLTARIAALNGTSESNGVSSASQDVIDVTDNDVAAS